MVSGRAKAIDKSSGKQGAMLYALAASVAFAIGIFVSATLGEFSFLYLDSYSYVTIALAMGVLFILFIAKSEKLKVPRIKVRSMLLGVLIFVIYIVLLSYAHASLSWLFLSYRVDVLLAPLLMLSIIVAIFGASSIKQYYPVLLYLLLLSVLILFPITSLNGGFINANANAASYIMHALGVNVASHSNAIVAPSGYLLELSSISISFGEFIAIVMLLLPITYLFEGRTFAKLKWLLASIILALVINLALILLSIAIWAYGLLGGIAESVLALFGPLSFYLAIIFALMLYRRFDLKLYFSFKWINAIRENIKSGKKLPIILSIALVILFGVISFLISLPYYNLMYLPSYYFSLPLSNTSSIQSQVISTVNASVSRYYYIGYQNGTMLFHLGSPNQTGYSAYLLGNIYKFIEPGGVTLNYTILGGPYIYLLGSGISVVSEEVKSYNTTFYVNYLSMPYAKGMQGATVNMMFFELANETSASSFCDVKTDSLGSISGYLESKIYDSLNRAKKEPLICFAYKIASTKTSKS